MGWRRDGARYANRARAFSPDARALGTLGAGHAPLTARGGSLAGDGCSMDGCRETVGASSRRLTVLTTCVSDRGRQARAARGAVPPQALGRARRGRRPPPGHPKWPARPSTVRGAGVPEAAGRATRRREGRHEIMGRAPTAVSRREPPRRRRATALGRSRHHLLSMQRRGCRVRRQALPDVGVPHDCPTPTRVLPLARQNDDSRRRSLLDTSRCCNGSRLGEYSGLAGR